MQINIGNNVVNKPFPPFPQSNELNLCTLPTDDPPITSRASGNPPQPFNICNLWNQITFVIPFLGLKKKIIVSPNNPDLPTQI